MTNRAFYKKAASPKNGDAAFPYGDLLFEHQIAVLDLHAVDVRQEQLDLPIAVCLDGKVLEPFGQAGVDLADVHALCAAFL